MFANSTYPRVLHTAQGFPAQPHPRTPSAQQSAGLPRRKEVLDRLFKQTQCIFHAIVYVFESKMRTRSRKYNSTCCSTSHVCSCLRNRKYHFLNLYFTFKCALPGSQDADVQIDFTRFCRQQARHFASSEWICACMCARLKACCYTHCSGTTQSYYRYYPNPFEIENGRSRFCITRSHPHKYTTTQ